MWFNLSDQIVLQLHHFAQIHTHTHTHVHRLDRARNSYVQISMWLSSSPFIKLLHLLEKITGRTSANTSYFTWSFESMFLLLKLVYDPGIGIFHWNGINLIWIRIWWYVGNNDHCQFKLQLWLHTRD